VAKAPDYNERSNYALEKGIEGDKAYADKINVARAEIFEDLDDTVKELKALRKNFDPNIKLKALREHLLLAGLYTEKHELYGKDGAALGVIVLPELKPEGAR